MKSKKSPPTACAGVYLDGEAVARHLGRPLRQEVLLDAPRQRQVAVQELALQLALVQADVGDRHADLRGEAERGRQLALGERAAAGPAIELDDAEDLVAERDRHAQHRARAHHQRRIGTGGLALALRVDDHEAFTARQRLLHQRAAVADPGRRAARGADAARHQLAAFLLVDQHQPALGARRRLEQLVEDEVEHRVFLERGAQDLRRDGSGAAPGADRSRAADRARPACSGSSATPAVPPRRRRPCCRSAPSCRPARSGR